MPSLEVGGSVMVDPLHTGAIGSKVGVTCGVTVTLSVAVVAHVLPVGVKVYVVVAVLFTAGDQVPAMPSLEVGGSVMVDPLHTGAIGSKVGVTCRVIVTLTIARMAHVLPVGVNVYVVVAVLFTAGDQVPAMPSFEVGGSVMVDPLHTGAIGSKLGVTCGVTVTLSVAVGGPLLPVGVKVYVVVAVLFKAGDQVPAMPSFEVGGSVMVDPLHTGAIGSKLGVTCGVTVTLSVAVGGPLLPVGVKVYVVVAVLFKAGDQVPAMPSFEVGGSVMADPLHTGAIGSKLGVTCGVTVTISVAVVAQLLPVGVKVYVVVAVLFTAGDQVPAMPSFEVGGSVMADPLHTGAIGSKLGVTCGVTVTISVAVVAQLLPVGVKVYVVVAVLFTAGDQVPAMPSFEVGGSVMADPLHTGAIGSKLGVTCGVTVTISVAVVAQLLPVGVKVYVVVAVLFTAGDQVPAMPSFEVGGSVMADPLHTGPTGSKLGVTCGVTVTISVAVVAQLLPVGVKVYVVVAVLFTAGDQVPA